MQSFDLGLNYFRNMQSRLDAMGEGEQENQLIRLTFELLIENQDRYLARAEFLLKNKVLQMQFGNYRVEYFIQSSLITFSYSEDNGQSYLSAHSAPLLGEIRSDLETISEVIAQAEAHLLILG